MAKIKFDKSGGALVVAKDRLFLSDQEIVVEKGTSFRIEDPDKLARLLELDLVELAEAVSVQVEEPIISEEK